MILGVVLLGGTISGGVAGVSAAAADQSSQVSPLVEAARDADWESVRSLIESGADVKATYADGSTALHWASYWDNLQIAERLLDAGAPAGATNELGATPLWAAALNGNAAMVRLLIEAGADPNTALLSGETPLMIAARSGGTEAVRILLEHGADANVKGTRDQTALMWAASHGHADVVRALLAGGADVHARSTVWTQYWQIDPGELVHPDLRRWIDHGGSTPLLLAAREGELEAAQALVEGGADVNAASAYGTSATVLAAHSGNAELVRFLLERGADPDAAAAGYAALHVALLRRQPEVVGILLEHGADPHAVLRTSTPVRRASNDYFFHTAFVGASALWLAARFGQPESMRLLVEAGADPLFEHSAEYWTSRVTTEGNFVPAREGPTTTLMAAVGMGARSRGWSGFQPAPADERVAQTLEAVRLAIELGVDVNAADADGRTALESAMALGVEFEPVVSLLQEHGAVLADAR
jgi:ankyrin repeat protein